MKQKILILGPCAAESEQQVTDTALSLQRVIANIGIPTSTEPSPIHILFRAGLWKPRSSPHSFQGVGAAGLQWLIAGAHTLGVPAITEVANADHLTQAYNAGIRHFWIGARTTTNPFLVQQLADTPLPDKSDIHWFVKNPTSPDLALWYGAIERLQDAGYTHLYALHRGFSMGETIATKYRNAPMWSIVFEMRRLYPNLPILTDASHIAGRADLVSQVAEQAMQMDMDGLMLEVHPQPQIAQSDATQQLTPEQTATTIQTLAHLFTHNHTAPLPPDCTLMQLRQQIDETDEQIWALISKRMDIARHIGEYKQTHHMPILQKTRYEQLLTQRQQWAIKHGIHQQAATQIFQAIHEESVIQQLSQHTT